MDDAGPKIRQPQPSYPFEAGTRVPFDLDSPCDQYDYWNPIPCGLETGTIEVKPFKSTYHFTLRCTDGHYVKHVGRAEVELRLGLPRTMPEKRATRSVFDPSQRIKIHVLLRDNQTCAYCARRQGELDENGVRIDVSVDHIIPVALLDPLDFTFEKELRLFARDIQLVTACGSHNAAKNNVFLPVGLSEELFVRNVLRSDSTGTNLALLHRFRTLYRLAEKSLARRDQA